MDQAGGLNASVTGKLRWKHPRIQEKWFPEIVLATNLGKLAIKEHI
jgi:hypothetical protein